MPYRWTPEPDDTDALRWHLTLWPHRSLPPRGFAWFIGLTAAMLMLPLLATGSVVLWVLLPFLTGALGLIWYFLQRSYADGALTEELTLHPDRITLTRHNPRGSVQRWQANPIDVRAVLHASGGPVENYLTLIGGGRKVELGAFLAPEERLDLYRELSDKLRSIDINTPHT